jgi:hypothetical protein
VFVSLLRFFFGVIACWTFFTYTKTGAVVANARVRNVW